MEDEVEEIVEEVVETPEAEVKAREHGWVPEEEFRGDKTQWVDADIWMSRSKTERLQEKAIREASAAMARMDALEKGREERALEKARATLREEANQALIDGDETKLNKAIDGLEQQTQQPQEAYSSPAEQQFIADWTDEKPAYKRADVGKSAYEESARIMQRQPNLPIKEHLAEVHIAMTKAYPEYFGNSARTAPPAVEGGGQRVSPPKAKVDPEFEKEAKAYAKNQATFGVYKGKSGKGYKEDFKLAKEGFYNSYDSEITEAERA